MDLAKRSQLMQLFRDAGSAHHRAFAATNGDDPAWPAWYAEWLAPRMQALLDANFDVAGLARRLQRLEDERQAHGLADWPAYYADYFLSGVAVLPR